MSVSSPVVAIATEPHLHTELIQLVVESVGVCVCVLLVPLCICVSVRRLTSVRKCGNSERFHSLFLVDLKVWNVEGVSAGLAVKSLESGTVMLLAVSLWKLVQLSVRLTGPPANGSPGALLQSGGGLRRHQQPGEVVSGLWCR